MMGLTKCEIKSQVETLEAAVGAGTAFAQHFQGMWIVVWVDDDRHPARLAARDDLGVIASSYTQSGGSE